MLRHKEGNNACRGCEQNCCVGFKIAKEISKSEELKRDLVKLPFIRQVDKEAILLKRYEKVVGIYNCDRLNDDGECEDYDNRPWFCEETGVSGIPHNQCLLK